jgi:hypothetical protein
VTRDRSVVSPGTMVSTTNKTDGHDITEILLKVALNTIVQPVQSLVYLIVLDLPLLITPLVPYMLIFGAIYLDYVLRKIP